ncbi:cell division protein FtsQ [Colwellia chukchiensis]|uniref:Cell division protein FtsQ n=1 Tax=Colwellia chukchiensis TaxID=641665 RepID=A0A1H7L5Z3_9GAMM|nr:cell division protein FtsQ/DivIB [Colwellia chukchiensis]SEK93825.1 cell division protein FtsQ [Colwellia chukchiensis]
MTTATAKQLSLAQESEKLHWSFWLGVAFFVAVIVGILSFSIFLNKRLSAEESAPVTSISIAGEMPYTTRVDIEQAIEKVNLGNFFHLDVNDVQQKVAKLPWVYSVSVRKKWPDELKIYVVDQTPIAHWNGDFLLNKNGKAFQADSKRLTEKLPAFFGPEGSEQIALENYINFNKLLGFSALAIHELVLTERFAWQLLLNDGVSLNLGRDNRVERLQRFMDVYPEIKLHKKQDQQVDYVDLRYDTGLAVGWKTADNKERV